MLYAPHKFRFKHPSLLSADEYGRPIKSVESEWEEGGDCRCDDNSVSEFTDDNGRVYRPTHKIVVDGYTVVQAGDEIEVYAKTDDTLRGKGKVYNVVRNNYLNYSTIWV